MSNYVLIPGYHSPGDDNFYPWLMDQLGRDGSTTSVISYNSLIDEKTEQEIVGHIASQVELDADTVLVGHSLGCALALKLLEQTNAKIAKLVLVAGFAKPEFKDKRRPFENKLKWEFDFARLKENISQTINLSDRTDFIVPESAAMELQEKLGGVVIIFSARQPHVKAAQEPAVLEAIRGTEDKPAKVVLMHGKDRGPADTWYPWLKGEAEAKGISFAAPTLPNTHDPVMEEWVAELAKTQPDENTTLVGHSRGGVAIMRWLENLTEGKKVKKAILIAANRGSDQGADYDYEKIKRRADAFVVFHSTDDNWVPYTTGQYNAENLQAKFYSFNDRRHFGTGVDSIPELLLEI